MGYTPNIVTGVWVGDDNNKQMHGLTGGTIPAKIWKDIMIVATQKYGNKDFDYPEVALNDKGKQVEEDAENETAKSEADEQLLKEANELKEKALESSNNSFTHTTKPAEDKPQQNKNQAPVPQVQQIPIAVPESLR